MNINLNTINEKGIIIDQTLEFTEDKYKTSIIKGLENIHIKGKIYYSITKEVIFDGVIKGDMLIVDSNTGDIVKYPFSTEISEILNEDSDFSGNLDVNNQNSLDLKEILWQNIVLEVPIAFSKTDKVNVTKGDGWEFINEENKVDPRLNVFKDLLDKGKE